MNLHRAGGIRRRSARLCKNAGRFSPDSGASGHIPARGSGTGTITISFSRSTASGNSGNILHAAVFAPVAAAAADDNRLAEVALGIIYFKIFAVFEQLFSPGTDPYRHCPRRSSSAQSRAFPQLKGLSGVIFFKLIERLLQPAFEIVFHISTSEHFADLAADQ